MSEGWFDCNALVVLANRGVLKNKPAKEARAKFYAGCCRSVLKQLATKSEVQLASVMSSMLAERRTPVVDPDLVKRNARRN